MRRSRAWKRGSERKGTRTIPGDPARGRVRVTIERPYLDADKMQMVEKTRIVVVTVWRRTISVK